MADTTTTTAATAKAKKAKIAQRLYVGPDGKTGKSAFPTATALQFVWADKRKPSVFEFAKLPQDIRNCAMFHGISQKCGDGFASAKGSIDTAQETAEAIWENLIGGTWIERSEGVGPAPSMVFEAIMRAHKTAGTKPKNDEAGIRNMLKDKATRDGALKDPAIAAAYAQIKAENAAARAKEAAAAAKGATVSVSF